MSNEIDTKQAKFLVEKRLAPYLRMDMETGEVVSSLDTSTLIILRRIVREEIEAALDSHEQHGLDRLLADIHRTTPLSEQEEMAAVLVTLSAEEWQALVARVNAQREAAQV
jgi:hypothetical protein